MRSLPLLAILLGLAGLIPFAALSFGAVALDAEWAPRSLLALSAYGAVILAFLGGVHWGLALAAGPPLTTSVQSVATQRARFALGVVPSLIGWAGLLVSFIGLPMIGLVVLVAGFIAVTVVEARATKAGLVPGSYMALRWVLSVGVILCLVSVLIVLAFGGRVIL